MIQTNTRVLKVFRNIVRLVIPLWISCFSIYILATLLIGLTCHWRYINNDPSFSSLILPHVSNSQITSYYYTNLKINTFAKTVKIYKLSYIQVILFSWRIISYIFVIVWTDQWCFSLFCYFAFTTINLALIWNRYLLDVLLAKH